MFYTHLKHTLVEKIQFQMVYQIPTCVSLLNKNVKCVFQKDKKNVKVADIFGKCVKIRSILFLKHL